MVGMRRNFISIPYGSIETKQVKLPGADGSPYFHSTMVRLRPLMTRPLDLFQSYFNSTMVRLRPSYC